MRGRGAVEVTADDGICLNDCFSTEDDALGSVDLGAAGDLVARVLSWLALGSWACRWGCGWCTVSMYSPLKALGGIMAIVCLKEVID